MTNKEKLEIIDKRLNVLYVKLENLHASEVQKNITQAIYNLESTKLLLEPIENILDVKNHHDYITEGCYIKTIKDKNAYGNILISDYYICPKCKKEVKVYGEFIDGQCLSCNQKLVKKEEYEKI